MSLGIFRSIRRTYPPKYYPRAERMIRRLNAELKARGLPEYHDPDPDERGLRRLPWGNAGASTFGALETFAEQAQLPWTLGHLYGERQIALPIELPATLSLTVGRALLVIPQRQDFASVRTIQQEIIALAPTVKIPLTNGILDDALAVRLADCLGVSDDEPAGLLENERALWLDLYYATRYCLEDGRPLVIA